MVDRPLIQHVVDEAREAGIEHFIFVTGRNKAVIEDHFDRQFELEVTLKERNKTRRPRSCSSQRPAGARHRELHPPAIAARPRPCGLVRARAGRPRAVRAAAARRAGAAQAGLPQADDRRLQRRRASNANIIAVEEVPIGPHRTSTASSASARPRARLSRSPTWWRSRRARRRRPTSSSPAATSCSRRFSICWRTQERRRRRRNPDHRRDDQARQDAAVLRLEVRGQAASTAAPRSASSPPMSPMRWSGPTSRPAFRAEIKKLLGD